MKKLLVISLIFNILIVVVVSFLFYQAYKESSSNIDDLQHRMTNLEVRHNNTHTVEYM